MFKQKKYGDVFVETEHLAEERTNPILFHLKRTRTHGMENEEYNLLLSWSSFNYGIYESSISHDHKILHAELSYYSLIWFVLTQKWRSYMNTKKTMFSLETRHHTRFPISQYERSRRHHETRILHSPWNETVKLVTSKHKHDFLF